MKIDRLLAIVILLINHKKISAKKLAERFEVSVRTIHRDMDAINLAGIPIMAFQGARGGYGIMEDYKIDRQLLSLEDISSILTGLKGVSKILDDRKVDDTIEKMTGLIKNWEIKKNRGITNHTIIDFSPFDVSEKIKEKVRLIRQAVNDSIMVDFSYTDINSKITKRVVEPDTLLFQGYHWYLQGYCNMRQDDRIFRLSRIYNLKLYHKNFIPKKNKTKIPPNIYEGVKNKSKHVDIELLFDKKISLRVMEYFGEEHTKIQKDGSLRLKVSFPEDEWVYSLIMSYGHYVKVIKPEHIKDIILKRAQAVCEMYDEI